MNLKTNLSCLNINIRNARTCNNDFPNCASVNCCVHFNTLQCSLSSYIIYPDAICLTSTRKWGIIFPAAVPQSATKLSSPLTPSSPDASVIHPHTVSVQITLQLVMSMMTSPSADSCISPPSDKHTHPLVFNVFTSQQV